MALLSALVAEHDSCLDQRLPPGQVDFTFWKHQVNRSNHRVTVTR